MRNWGMPPSGSTSGSGPPFKESVDSPSSIRQVLPLVARSFCPDSGQDSRKPRVGQARSTLERESSCIALDVEL